MQVSASIGFLVSALLLVPVGEAVGASAWALWLREERFWNPKGGGWGSHTANWNLLGASSRKRECRRILRETVERVTRRDEPPSDADVLHEVSGDRVTFVFYPKNAKPTDTMTHSQIFHYFCLPDTVDPREGREGK
jgi:hypothetical protein